MMHHHCDPHGQHGPGGTFDHGMRIGHGGRARRGDVTPAVLLLLKESGMHGYQIIQELTERSGGAWTPSPGSIYPTLQMLEHQGLVVSEQDGGRRVFSLTEAGRQHAETLPSETPWDEMALESDPMRRLRESFHGLMAVASQVVHTGAADQIDKTADILAAARKDVVRLLAGDE